MKPFYVATLNPIDALITISILLTIVVGLFVMLPGLSRKLDRVGGRPLAKIRVVASFGGPSLRSGGAFYRFSMYERYLVVCFMTAHSYAYENVHFQQPFKNGENSLALLLNGTPVILYGNTESLERFSKALAEYVKLAGKK